MPAPIFGCHFINCSMALTLHIPPKVSRDKSMLMNQTLIKPLQNLASDTSQTWRPLLFLTLYRLFLGSLFVLIIIFPEDSQLLGQQDPQLFAITSLFYLAFGCLTFLGAKWHWPAFNLQVFAQIFLDILVIIVLMHSSGGIPSGLGTLIIVAIAGGSILIAEKMAILFAAIATIALLLEQLYTQLQSQAFNPSYAHAGLLGATFFATAAAVHLLARRIRYSEALAAQRGVDLANMEQLTEYVIQRMQTGIIVVDKNDQIRLINESARYLLNVPVASKKYYLSHLSTNLTEQLRAWQQNLILAPQLFRPSPDATEILPRFARLGTDNTSGTLIFLEDMAALAQQAQQMKLASLGRLTASIAHEVRNPLGAISHAGQLLAESKNLDSSDHRLTEIISQHCKRVNKIVENVMQLGKRDKSKPEEILLKPWLENFIIEFCNNQGIQTNKFSITVSPIDLKARFDPSQLLQVIWNLCHNGMRHTIQHSDRPVLELRAGIAYDSRNPILDIIDLGPGIAPEITEQIFEPFFTTEPKGTGLGLYIARELCEGNQARLAYIRTSSGESCFRITFADSRRIQVI